MDWSRRIRKAKSDWDDIDADLLKWVGGGGVAAGLTAGLQSAFSRGKFSLELPAAGFASMASRSLFRPG